MIADEKRCSVCQLVKSASDFGLRSDGRFLRSECRLCRNARSRKRYWRKRDEVARTYRRWHLRTRYGLTEADYEALLERQGGGCAICGSPTVRDRTRNQLYVDHDHQTGRVRGLLCSPCNSGLGAFRDSRDLLLVAVSYLAESE